MDKDRAMERLDAIEKEARELRKIINGNIVYDNKKIYVALSSYKPFIMAGSDHMKYYRFHCFNGYAPTEQGWNQSYPNGQACLDAHVKDGLDIHVFDDTKEALQFFIDNL